MKKMKCKEKLIKEILVFTPITIAFVYCTLYFLHQHVTKSKLIFTTLCTIIISVFIIYEIISKKRVSKSLQRSKENELKIYLFALQSQMDLHFWNNMLGMISLEAQLKNTNNITKVCGELSKMLTFTSSLGDGFCTLEEELMHAQSYMDIMKMRYEDYFEYQIDVPEDMKWLRVPKYIIQPICENAFLHAFKDKDLIWKIHIECNRNDKQWFVIVSDNGIGLEEETLNKVRTMTETITIDTAMMQMESLSFGGLSFPNVYLRLLLTYFDKAIFEVKNTASGASIILGGEIGE